METILLKDKELSRIVKSALEREKDIIDSGISKTLVNLKQFESKYGICSEEFYRKYLQGEMGDDMEIMTWASEHQALKRLQKDKSYIAGVDIVS
ncbi:MAG: hypothetical protein ACUZ8O_13095 [Candidatus Anammoxibacter sp.]